MPIKFNPINNPRVIIIQKIYSQFYNMDSDLVFEKHRFKKFIKFVVNGTLERNELIDTEIFKYLKEDLDLKKIDKVFEVIIKSAIFEFLYRPATSPKIIIKEYLNASNFFINNSQTKYLNAILDKISKKIRNNERV